MLIFCMFVKNGVPKKRENRLIKYASFVEQYDFSSYVQFSFLMRGVDCTHIFLKSFLTL